MSTDDWTPERIRELMHTREQTVGEFAESLKVKRGTVHTWLNGSRKPSRLAVWRLNQLRGITFGRGE